MWQNHRDGDTDPDPQHTFFDVQLILNLFLLNRGFNLYTSEYTSNTSVFDAWFWNTDPAFFVLYTTRTLYLCNWSYRQYKTKCLYQKDTYTIKSEDRRYLENRTRFDQIIFLAFDSSFQNNIWVLIAIFLTGPNYKIITDYKFNTLISKHTVIRLRKMSNKTCPQWW